MYFDLGVLQSCILLLFVKNICYEMVEPLLVQYGKVFVSVSQSCLWIILKITCGCFSRDLFVEMQKHLKD
jgi:hypothetical protein